MEKSIWYQKVNAVFTGILVYAIAGFAHAIIGPFADMADGFSFLGGMGGMDTSSFDTLSNIDNVTIIAVIVGYILFLRGLGGFAGILDSANGEHVKKIRTGVILGLIAAALDFIPLMGWISTIVDIVAFIIMLMAYSALKNSATFPPKARSGAGRLFVSQILLLIGAVLGFIPFIGGVFDGILSFIAFIFVLVGWSAIRSAGGQPQNNSANVNYGANPTYMSPPPPPTAVMYNVLLNNTQQGPYDLATLQNLVRNGQLTCDTLVWKTGMSQWSKAADCADLQALFGAASSG